MIRPHPAGSKRAGVIAPLTALLLIGLIGMTAFAVDLGYVVLVESDLHNAADSAALAGTDALQTYFVQWNLAGVNTGKKGGTSQATLVANGETAARAAAKQFA